MDVPLNSFFFACFLYADDITYAVVTICTSNLACCIVIYNTTH